MVACAKVIAFFFGLFSCFLLVGQKHYKNRFFDDFEMLIFSFFGQKSRVNNLAMVGSITWPYFWPKICPERWPGYWPYFFHTFFLTFFKNLIFPAERRGFLKKTKNTTKNNKKQMARLLTYDGQVIDPTAYIYIIYIEREFQSTMCTSWFKPLCIFIECHAMFVPSPSRPTSLVFMN